jgi:hypothetical protein
MHMGFALYQGEPVAILTTDSWGMMALNDTTSRVGERAVTLTESPDIGATIGRPGLLEERAGAAITRLPAMRSDVLARYVRANTIPAGALITSLHMELFQPDPLEPDQTIDNLVTVAKLLAGYDVTLFLFTVSTYDPTQRVHRYGGAPDTFAMRAHRLLANLEHRAGDAGIQVIDVDGAVAEVGGIDTVPGPGELTGAALDFLTEEAVTAIDQSGALGGTLQAPVMRLVIPSFDRRTRVGTVTRWHVSPGTAVADGDPLFDFRFETRVHRFDMGHEDENTNPEKTGGRSRKAERVRSIDITVVAGGAAYLREITVPHGAAATAGDVAGVMATSPEGDAGSELAGADFRVGTRTAE